jgi:hypothetical protein
MYPFSNSFSVVSDWQSCITMAWLSKATPEVSGSKEYNWSRQRYDDLHKWDPFFKRYLNHINCFQNVIKCRTILCFLFVFYWQDCIILVPCWLKVLQKLQAGRGIMDYLMIVVQVPPFFSCFCIRKDAINNLWINAPFLHLNVCWRPQVLARVNQESAIGIGVQFWFYLK